MTNYLNSATQYVEVTIAAGATSGTATITAVGALAFCVFGGLTTPATAGNDGYSRVELTNTTTVTAFRNTSNASFAVTVRCCVVDPNSSLVSSVQSGTITMTGAGSNTATITAVTTTRALVIYLGNITTVSGAASTSSYASCTLTNGTTVTATRTGTTGNATVGYVVVEFQSAVVQSLQQFSVASVANTAAFTQAITSVTTSNSLLFYGGMHSGVSAQASAFCTVELTNATTLTFTRTGTSSTSKTIRVTVIEFVSGVLTSCQRGTTAVASTTSADTTITSVTMNNAILTWGCYRTNGTNFDDWAASTKLFAATTARSQKNTGSTSTSTTAWEVAEFSVTGGATFNAGWATGATKIIGGAF